MRSIEITPSMVDDFCRITGDFNEIHKAADRGVVPGMLIASLFASGNREGYVIRDLSFNFKREVYVGDVINIVDRIVKTRATSKFNIHTMEYSIDTDGQLCVVVNATIIKHAATR
jgi:hypothetical protein